MTEGVDGQLLNPLEIAKDILRVELWSKQEEVLSALFENRRVAVKSGNGLGKGYCAAVAVLWFLYCHDPAIVCSGRARVSRWPTAQKLRTGEARAVATRHATGCAIRYAPARVWAAEGARHARTRRRHTRTSASSRRHGA